jgi:hypothetical protein
LRAELLKAEAAHFAKKNGTPMEIDGGEPASVPSKRAIGAAMDGAEEVEDAETKRRRLILEEAQELDADSAGSSEEDSDEEYVLRNLICCDLTALVMTKTKTTSRRPSCVNWPRLGRSVRNREPKRYAGGSDRC